MIGLIYSENDTVSKAAGEHILQEHESEIDEWKGFERIGEMVLCKSKTDLLHCEYLDGFGFDSLLIVSRHKSEKGVVSFTAHSTGNWTNRADFGGMPMKLSIAEPLGMREFLLGMTRERNEGIDVIYEATHHGPLLKTPSCFLEFGGPTSVMGNSQRSALLGRIAFDCAMKLAEKHAEIGKVAIGIGGTHYANKFTRLAVEKEYAFSHIMPKHAIINKGPFENISMIEAAVDCSGIPPECAVIDWKSMNSELRGDIIKKLDDIGLDYERI